MANPNPHMKGRFKKGESGNPSGRPAVPKDLRNVRNLHDGELKRLISKYLRMTQRKLKDVANEEQHTPMIDSILAAVLINAHAKGDIYRILPLLERLCGRVAAQPTEVELPQPMIIKRRNGETIELTTNRQAQSENDGEDEEDSEE